MVVKRDTDTGESEFAPLTPQEDESDLVRDEPVKFNAAISSTDWTVETVISQLKKGNIFLDPDYQRRDAWTVERKSKYIESLIIGIPTPQIILAERKEKRGSYIVIDGKQRLLSLRQFSAHPKNDVYTPFSLKHLDVRRDLNGKTFDDITLTLLDGPSADFENATVRTVVIRSWPSEDYLYEVFLRINSGSVQLSPQELRQALHPGPFTKALNEFVLKSSALRSILNIEKPDFRMRDNEIALRFIAFRYALDDYQGNMKNILDDVTFWLNSDWDQTERIAEEAFRDLEFAIDVTQKVFGRQNAFKKWNGRNFERRINRAIFDVMAYYFTDEEVADRAVFHREAVVAAFKELCSSDREFDAAVSGTTKSLGAVSTRFELWADALSEATGLEIIRPLD